MTTVVTRGAASAQALGYASSSAAVNYIEDVFSTYLYTGNGSTQTITNGIDLSGKGGLVWLKSRSNAYAHCLYDTVRGPNQDLHSNSTQASGAISGGLTAFGATGFSLDSSNAVNQSAATYASWTFREQPKFFDIVTYTGNDAPSQTINHNLGSVPGCIIIKSTQSGSSNWQVYHRSVGNTGALQLNTTSATSTSSSWWNDTTPTATQFTVGSNNNYSSPTYGGTYVAYLFAHDAGGFGLTGTDNVISCGSFTTDGSGNATVSLGYEPQWFLRKETSSANDWVIFDNMRGWSLSDDAFLYPNSSSAEASANRGNPTATGFTLTNQSASADFIYIAIRRGPMKVPTSGTSVYNAIARTGTGADVTVTGIGFTPDLLVDCNRDATASEPFRFWFDRLRGLRFIASNNSLAEAGSTTSVTGFDIMNAIKLGTSERTNASGLPYINWFFRRAPGFFDEVCYSGTGVARTVAHNLAAVPELMIVKLRDQSGSWRVYASPLTATSYLGLNQTTAAVVLSDMWNNTAPTASVFTVGTSSNVNDGAFTYVAYLFATCPGVSKVGSYTGNGTTQTINCGFTAGARFVLIKRTDSTGDWYVWDSARGIVAGNDPYLFLNSTDAEVTSTDYVDTYSAGFEISSTAPAAINANGGSFIFFAVA